MSPSVSTWRLAAGLGLVLALTHQLPARAEPDEDPGPAASPAVQKPETKARQRASPPTTSAARSPRRRPTTISPSSSSRASSGRRAASTRRRSAPRARWASPSSCRAPRRGAGLPTRSSRCWRCASRRATCRSCAQPSRATSALPPPPTMPAPGRVEAWLAGRRGLPAETRAYVRAVTGHSADAWASDAAAAMAGLRYPQGWPCVELAKSFAASPAPAGRTARARRGGPGVCSSPATGRRAACSPAMSGCVATRCRPTRSAAPGFARRAFPGGAAPPSTWSACRRAAG